MVEFRKSLDILNSERLVLVTTKNTTNCGVAHRSLEENPDFMVASQVSQEDRVRN